MTNSLITYDYISYNKMSEEVELVKYDWEYNTIIKISRYDIQEKFMRYWGSFLANLWVALAHADMTNAKKIMDTRSNYIIDYVRDGLLTYEE